MGPARCATNDTGISNRAYRNSAESTPAGDDDAKRRKEVLDACFSTLDFYRVEGLFAPMFPFLFARDSPLWLPSWIYLFRDIRFICSGMSALVSKFYRTQICRLEKLSLIFIC